MVYFNPNQSHFSKLLHVALVPKPYETRDCKQAFLAESPEGKLSHYCNAVMPAHSNSGKLLKQCIQFLQTLKVFSSLSFNLFYLGFICPFGFILYPLISMVYTNSSLKLQKLLKATVHYFS